MISWQVAMRQALYGPDGFYLRSRAAAHFRTSVHVSRRFAVAVARLLTDVDAALGHPPRLDLVDVGAGGGELLASVLEIVSGREAAGDGTPGEHQRCGWFSVRERLALCAVEMAPRPDELPSEIAWCSSIPSSITGLVIANEWLDNIPLDVAELTPDGPRLVLVDPATGSERLGPPPSVADAEWLARWWPIREPGGRAEIGHPRCAAWSSVLSSLRAGVAVAIDYGHLRSHRPLGGTLAGYRDGRSVPPVPDGSCDITAHVAMDACASLVPGSRLITQRAALLALGLSGERPPLELARSDPREYVSALCAASEEAELIDPSGLGGFWWLVVERETMDG